MHAAKSIFIRYLFTSLVPSTIAVCTRNGISSALDKYFSGGINQAALQVAPAVKISSNGYMQNTVADTAFGNITSAYRPKFKVQALDTAACQGARYSVVTEKNRTTGAIVPALVSLRLMLDDNDGPIKEIEVMNVVRGQHILFYPDKFEETTPDLFSSSQVSDSSHKILSRQEIISVANTYLEGVQSGNNSLVKAGPTCPRISNGLQTSGHCDQGMQQFKWPVESRRWIADTETGVAFGVFIFRGALMVDNKTGDYINEYLKIRDGKIQQIRAVMIYSDKYIKSVWPEDSERHYKA
jgi:hypothetical protein